MDKTVPYLAVLSLLRTHPDGVPSLDSGTGLICTVKSAAAVCNCATAYYNGYSQVCCCTCWLCACVAVTFAHPMPDLWIVAACSAAAAGVGAWLIWSRPSAPRGYKPIPKSWLTIPFIGDTLALGVEGPVKYAWNR